MNPGYTRPKSDVDIDTANLERERLEMDTGKVDFQQQLERERFEFEKSSTGLEERRIKLEEAKAAKEGRLLTKYLGTVITAIISLAAVLVSVSTIYSKDKELAMVNAQKSSELDLLKKRQDQEWSLNTAKFFTEHNKEIFSGKPKERDAILRILFLTLPKDVIAAISQKDPAIGRSIERARNSIGDVTTGDVGLTTKASNVSILTTPRKINRVIIRETYYTNAPQLLKVLREGKVPGSYHYLVDTNGIVQRVFDQPDELVLARHSRALSKDSVGIGMVHKTGENTYTQAQLQGLVTLLIELCGKYGIPTEGILTSSQVPPFRNTDIKEFLEEIRAKVKNKDRSAFRLPSVKRIEPIDSAAVPTHQPRADLETTINKLIVDGFGVKESQVKPNARFLEDFGADDLDMVEFRMRLEEDLKLEITDEDAATFKKVKDVYDYLEKRRRQ